MKHNVTLTEGQIEFLLNEVRIQLSDTVTHLEIARRRAQDNRLGGKAVTTARRKALELVVHEERLRAIHRELNEHTLEKGQPQCLSTSLSSR